ncbi:MAG: aspartate aminotransferase family protein [Wolinella sp.]
MEYQNEEELDRAYVLHSYARNYIHFTHGKGAVLFDSCGRDYIDFAAGIAVCSVGHGNERLAEAISDQARKLIHISNLYYIDSQARLAKRLVELSGYDMRLFFANSGAEANEGAIKIARKFGEEGGEVKRYKIITLESSFHGRTITALKATGQEKMHHYFGPYPDGFVYAKNIEHVFELVDDHTCAVLLELVQGEGGIEPQEVAGIQRLAQFLKEKNVLLMVDEVQTGIYRSGKLFASQVYGITPDVITMAKGLAGGVPIGAVMSGLKDIFAPGDHGSTFGGNPLATRAALTVLEILSEQERSGALQRSIDLFSAMLAEVCAQFPQHFERDVGLGLMRGIRAKSAEIQAEAIKKAFQKRVLVLRSGRNTIRFLPPLTLQEHEMREGFTRFKEACEEL